MAPRSENVQLKLEGDILWLGIDLTKPVGLTSKGNKILLAVCRQQQLWIDGRPDEHDTVIGMTVTQSLPKE